MPKKHIVIISYEDNIETRTSANGFKLNYFITHSGNLEIIQSVIKIKCDASVMACLTQAHTQTHTHMYKHIDLFIGESESNKKKKKDISLCSHFHCSEVGNFGH